MFSCPFTVLLLSFICLSITASPLSPQVGSNPPVTDFGLGDADVHAECGGMLFEESSTVASQGPRLVSSSGTRSTSTKSYVTMKFDIDMTPSLGSTYTCQRENQIITLPSSFISSYRCSSESSSNCIVRCTAADVVTDAKRAAALALLQSSTDWFSQALQVDSAPVNFSTSELLPPCAGWDYATSAHFKIFVILAPLCGGQAVSSGILGCASKSLLGQALKCTSSSVTKRPLSAVVILSVNLFQSVSSALVTHELTHALGFNSDTAAGVLQAAVYVTPSNRAQYDSSNQYYYYADDVPFPSGSAGIAGTLSLPATKFPTVAKQLRLHLGCPTSVLPDNKLFIPWENQGSSGSRNTHWETRVFGNEFMVAALPAGTTVISRMTLAFLHDTAWYSVTPDAMSTYGEELQWGKGLGCGFLTGKCSDWISGGMAAFASSAQDKASLTAYQNTLFCNKDYKAIPDDCTYDGSAIGSCSLRTYSAPISPSMFQYAALASGKGGDSSWADYCPFVSGFSGTACTVDDPSKYRYNPELIPYGNVGGPTNVCIKGTLSMPAIEPFSAMSCMYANCVNPTTMALYNVENKEWGLCERQSDGSFMAFKSGSGSWKDVRCPWPKFACGETALKKAMPVISSIFPTRGPAYGGHPLTITGTNFMSFFVGAPDVGYLEALGISFPVSQVVVESPYLIIARTGDLSQVTAHSTNISITWTDPFRRKSINKPSSRSSTSYFIDVNWPRITSLEPTSGQSDGGAIITLRGLNFPLSKIAGNYIQFSNAKQFEFTVISSKEITLVLPPQGEIGPSVGSDLVNVEASVDDAKMVYADMQFEYICEGPCYFKSMIVRYWWATLIISCIVAVISFYLCFRHLLRQQAAKSKLAGAVSMQDLDATQRELTRSVPMTELAST